MRLEYFIGRQEPPNWYS